MPVVFKYPLSPGICSVSLPGDSKPLSVGIQGGTVVMWVLVDSYAADTRRFQVRNFWVDNTGNEFPKDSANLQDLEFLGTVSDDGIVWHVFEVKRGY